MTDGQAPRKRNAVKIEPLWVKNKAIGLAQAQPVDVAKGWRVIRAAYAEFLGKLDPPPGPIYQTPASHQEKMRQGGVLNESSAGAIVGSVFYAPRVDYLMKR